MIPLDGSYLYALGKELKAIPDCCNSELTYIDFWARSVRAKEALDGFIGSGSVFVGSHRLSHAPGERLSAAIQLIYDKAAAPSQNVFQSKVDTVEKANVVTAFYEFETVFKAEFRAGNIFFATAKGAFDLPTLVNYGEQLFPSDFPQKVSSAVFDARQGARCLAFELWTASGFHFHRANESVVVRYYESIAGGKKLDIKDRNLGRYIKQIEALPGHNPSIVTCLKNLKDFHRNPLMHPEQNIESMDDAIALLNNINTAVAAMLKEIEATV